MTGPVWVLNLDAEDELAALRAGRRFVPSPDAPGSPRARARRRLARALRRLDGARLPGDGRVRGGVGRAWMPTPSAIEALVAAGVAPPAAPSPRALIAANARETARGLALPPELALPSGATAPDLDALRRSLARPGVARAPGVGRAPAWVVRPSLTSAGRARLIVDAGAPLDAGIHRFAASHLAAGPLDVAPLVDIARELTLHGWLGEDGRLQAGRPLVQDARGGAWRRSRAEPTLPAEVIARLRLGLESAAAALRDAGYFGPFGIDACEWRDGDGRIRLHAPMEINARFTMGWWRSGLARLACR